MATENKKILINLSTYIQFKGTFNQTQLFVINKKFSNLKEEKTELEWDNFMIKHKLLEKSKISTKLEKNK